MRKSQVWGWRLAYTLFCPVYFVFFLWRRAAGDNLYRATFDFLSVKTTMPWFAQKRFLYLLARVYRI